MFGDDPDQPTVHVCCGPRCGAEPGHRSIYAAVEKAVEGEDAVDAVVRPTMCRGFCGMGVTLGLPNGVIVKLRDADEARARIEEWKDNERKCQP